MNQAVVEAGIYDSDVPVFQDTPIFAARRVLGKVVPEQNKSINCNYEI
jgi:hypothetical protein